MKSFKEWFQQYGLATVIFILGVGTLLFFNKILLINDNSSTRQVIIYYSTYISLILITTTTLACIIHAYFFGSSSNERILTDIKQSLESLAKLLKELDLKIREAEEYVIIGKHTLTPKGHNALNVLKKLFKVLNSRYMKIDKMITGSTSAMTILEADELLRKRIFLHENCSEGLIDMDPLPPLKPEDCRPLFHEYSEDLLVEIQRSKQHSAVYHTVQAKRHHLPFEKKVANSRQVIF
jgi:hypothetical protein